MTAATLNHVSVVAGDLERSIRFYEDLLAFERLPTPNFGFPVQWLGGDAMQLHLFQRPGSAPTYQHFALEVDDFAGVHDRARALGAFDRTAFGHHLYELPGDVAQLYLRDPGGNLIEVDAPGASRLPAGIRTEMRRLADAHPQDAESRRARLLLGAFGGAEPRVGARPSAHRAL